MITEHHATINLSTPQALYNIAKVAREDFTPFFPEVFEALFKLCADSERNVQNAAQFLDNLIKVRLISVRCIVIVVGSSSTPKDAAEFLDVLIKVRL